MHVFFISNVSVPQSHCVLTVSVPRTTRESLSYRENICQVLPLVDFNVEAIPIMACGTKIVFVQIAFHPPRPHIISFNMHEIFKTRQMMLNGLISLDSHLRNRNLILGSDSMIGVHAEETGASLYIYKCAEVPIAGTDFPCCTEEVPVLLDNATAVRSLNPTTQMVYRNLTLTL